MPAERKNIINRKKLQKFYTPLKTFLRQCTQKIRTLLSQIIATLQTKIGSWWQMTLVFLFAVVFLYYPIGGWLINDIDTSDTYKPQVENNQLAFIDMMSHLINREVYHKIWTPNLPFLFPSYFLDNMPNFQLGLMSAVSKTASALGRIPLTAVSPSAQTELNEGVELLQYPGNVWLFSPQNKLLPAPSSSTQYKKGRKKLNNFNREIAAGRVILNRNADNLSIILKIAQTDLGNLLSKTDSHIRETHDSTVDFKADDIFYFNLGKLYGYKQIFNALGQDYKNTLIRYDIYASWTAMLNFLNRATNINPAIIRNGRLDSSIAPNHLITINYFASRAVNILNGIIDKLNQNMDLRQ